MATNCLLYFQLSLIILSTPFQNLPGPNTLRIAISRERPNEYHTFLDRWKARRRAHGEVVCMRVHASI